MSSSGFRPLDEKSLREYIRGTPSLSSRLGNQLDQLVIKEVGDGNLNFVYIVTGPGGSLVIKQALPYVRLIGESWQMTRERAYFEATALKEHGRLCRDHVPEVYHFDRDMSLIGMRYLEPPHIILRKGLVAGIEYPLLAEHISEYMARTLFFTSLLYSSTTDHKRRVAEFCGNVEMCRLTEQVVFSDPYKVSEHNRWTSPHLDRDAEAVLEDNVLKLEVAGLKSMFCERAQALIHADLHTSSVMVTCDSTQIIDSEFAFYGPMGFDIGAFLGNLILAFFAQDGHANQDNDRNAYKQWILRTLEETWNLFYQKFTGLWNEHRNGPGEAYLPLVYNNVEVQLLVQKKFMKELFHDSLGFGAAKMISSCAASARSDERNWSLLFLDCFLGPLSSFTFNDIFIFSQQHHSQFWIDPLVQGAIGPPTPETQALAPMVLSFWGRQMSNTSPVWRCLIWSLLLNSYPSSLSSLDRLESGFVRQVCLRTVSWLPWFSFAYPKKLPRPTSSELSALISRESALHMLLIAWLAVGLLSCECERASKFLA